MNGTDLPAVKQIAWQASLCKEKDSSRPHDCLYFLTSKLGGLTGRDKHGQTV